MSTAQKAAIVTLLVLGLLGALWAAVGRIATEGGSETVALCLDDLEVRQLAALTGLQPAGLLAQLKAAGATHVAVSERTLGELLQTGELRVDRREKGMACLYGPGAVALAVGSSPKLSKGGVLAMVAESMAGPGWLVVPEALLTMPDMGVDYPIESVATANSAGLGVVARPMPDYLVTPDAVASSLQQARDIGASIVLFNGVSVAGGAKLAKSTAETMSRLGLKFGFVELVPQEGAAALASALKYQLVRTHSISQEEMTKTSATRGLDRFSLAVTERNIRLCYIRLLLTPQTDILKANADYLKSIRDALSRNGHRFGEPRPFGALSVPMGALVLLALGVVGGGLWLVQLVLALPVRWFFGLCAVGVLVALGGSAAAPGLVRALFPLIAAIAFPTAAIMFTSGLASRSAGTGGPPLVKAIGLIVLAAVITALGGLLIAGLLSSLDYMMQISQFRGVKFAQLLPLMIVLVVMLARTFGPTDARNANRPATGWAALRAGLVTATGAVVRYWHAIAIFAALGAVAFMIMRSGNESAVEVSSLELKLRALLDQILVVRPRTKEIFFGYPALLMGLYLLLRARPRAAWVFLTFGSIAVISLTNTFCHLHTPLWVSVIRAVNGVWVGLLVGILWLVAKHVLVVVLRSVWWTDNA